MDSGRSWIEVMHSGLEQCGSDPSPGLPELQEVPAAPCLDRTGRGWDFPALLLSLVEPSLPPPV